MTSGQEGTATLKFEDAVSAQRAIFNEDGNIWLGKNLKVSICNTGLAVAVVAAGGVGVGTNESPSKSLSSGFPAPSAFPRPISPAFAVGEDFSKAAAAASSGVSADFFDFAKSLQLPYHPHLAGQIYSIPPGLHLMVAAGASAQPEPVESAAGKTSCNAAAAAFECNDLF
jgi:hypothetical protein